MDKDDDKTLFEKAMQGVTPLSGDDKIHFKKKPSKIKKPSPDQEAPATIFFHDDSQYISEYPADFFYVKSGLQHREQQKLRQGKIRPQAVLDLHGYTIEQAKEAVGEYLSESLHAGYRCIKIIHGKGHTRGPILRNKVYQWLPQVAQVMAVSSTVPADGGTGAVYVLLKRKP